MALADALSFVSSENLTAGQLECIQKCLLNYPTETVYSNMTDAKIEEALIVLICGKSCDYEK